MNTRRQILKLGLATSICGVVGTSAAQVVTNQVHEKPNRLVFVHGRSQQGKNPAELKALWTDSLRRGARKIGRDVSDQIEIAFPFYGDKLNEFASLLKAPLTTDIQSKGADVNMEFLTFQAEMAEDLRQRAGVTDDQINTEYGDNTREKGPQNWEWVQAILRAVDKHTNSVSQKSLEVFMRDVFLYTRRALVRDEIDRIVASEISEEPAVVVGHSLGTVVAYSVLKSDPRTLNVPLYVTLGSPLGIRSIRNFFSPLKFPADVSAWHNAYDDRDVVALYPLDSDNFNVTPAINNDANIKNHTDNRHGIVGYLDDRTVAMTILNALR